MSRVGRDHAARSFLTIECERVCRQILAPKGRLEIFAERVGFLREGARGGRMPQRRGQRRRVPFGAINVGLHLAQRDRPLGCTAILVKDRVVRVFPTLINQTVRVLTLVFYESVAVRIAIGIEPAERSLDVRPELPDGVEITGAFEILAEQQHEQRSRVDTAVIARKRYLAKPRHLAIAHLVQDLTGFGIPFGIYVSRLRRGEKPQHALGDQRIDPQSEKGSKNSIAPKRGAEPRDPSEGIWPKIGIGQQHVEIGDRAARKLVEKRVGAVEAGRPAAGGFQRSSSGAERAVEFAADAIFLGIFIIAGDAQYQPHPFAGAERQLEQGRRRIEASRRGLEFEAGGALNAIKTVISQRDRGVGLTLSGDLTTASALFSSHLEQIGKI